MKLQWVLVAIVLAAVVFGFTYLKLNSGATKVELPPTESEPPPKAGIKLYFPQTTARAEQKTPAGAECEYRVPGSHEFWFENIHDEPITVGLFFQTCKCTKVEIALASDEWNKWNDSVYRWARREPDRDWHALLDRNASLSVPPHATGWVRVNWKIDDIGPHVLKVQIWSHAPDSGTPPIELITPVLVVPPATVDEHVKSVGILTAEQGESIPAEFLCWSATRTFFNVKPGEGTDPFLVLAKPIPLTSDERKRVADALGSRVLCGYRIRVTVRDRLEDGRPIELGPFRRAAILQIDEEKVPLLDDERGPLKISVTGRVKGDVAVYTSEGPDQIEMGNKGYFDAKFGDVKEATLETRNPDLSLAFEKAPSFLKVNLNEPKIVSGVKTWRIRVDVPGGKVAGEFPREDNPEYRDSAIYLKVTDAKHPNDKPRLIRIPVSGKASSR